MEIKLAMNEMESILKEMNALAERLDTIVNGEITGDLSRSDYYIISTIQEQVAVGHQYITESINSFQQERDYSSRDLSKENVGKVIEMLKAVKTPKGPALEDNNRKVADIMTALDTCGAFFVVQDIISLIYVNLKDVPWRSITPFFTKLKKMNVLSKEEIADLKDQLKG